MKRYPKIEPEETFRLMTLLFNISLALHIVKGREPQGHIIVKDHEGYLGWIAHDDKIVAAMPESVLDMPIIMATMPDESRYPIDGHHRMHKALAVGREKLLVHVLSIEETKAVCMSKDVWRSLVKGLSAKAKAGAR